MGPPVSAPVVKRGRNVTAELLERKTVEKVNTSMKLLLFTEPVLNIVLTDEDTLS